MAKVDPRYFYRDDGLALDVSSKATRLDRSFHRSLRITMDPADPWHQLKSNRRRAREMNDAREFWTANEDAFVRDVTTKAQLEESASWTFSYRGQLETLPPLYRKRVGRKLNESFKFTYPTDFEGNYQIEFSDTGVRLRKRIRLYIRGDEILPINHDPRWLESVRRFAQPPPHIGAEWFDYVMYMGDEFSLTVLDSHRRQTRDVFGDLEPIEASVSVEHARAFLKWASGDLLRASLHRHPNRPCEKYLIVRSLNRPTLWTPNPSERVIEIDPLPTYPDAAAHLKLVSDLRLTTWAGKHGYAPIDRLC